MSSQNYTMNSTSLRSPTAQGKVKIKTTIQTDEVLSTEDGVTEKTITKTMTDFFSDGSSTTRSEAQSSRLEEQLFNHVNLGLVLGQSSGAKAEEVTTGGETSLSRKLSRGRVDEMNFNGGLYAGSHRRYETVIQPSNPLPTNTNITTYSSPTTAASANYTVYQQPNVLEAPPRVELETDEHFINEAMYAHNVHRGRHRASPLAVNLELCKLAEKWATRLATIGSMENSHYGYGENIYWSSAPVGSIRGHDPVDYWYNEISQFDWRTMEFQKSTGSFTQIIWRDSREFGIAKATSTKGTYVVAFYSPPGNVLGHFKENVIRP